MSDKEVAGRVLKLIMPTLTRLARETVQQAYSSGVIPIPEYRPGTITVGAAPGSDIQVTLDGDATAIHAQNFTSFYLAVGQRVMVRKLAPQGALVESMISAPKGVPILIYEQVADGATNSYTFGSIPQNYTHLRYEFTWNSVANQDIVLQFNGDGAANYYRTVAYWSYGGALAQYGANEAGAFVGNAGEGGLRTTRSVGQIGFYNSSVFKKSVSIQSDTLGATLTNSHGGAVWENTGPITSIRVSGTVGVLGAGSILRFWGVA